MDADDSCVIVGSRKSLPQVYIATEAETNSSNLRHRYSSGSSSTGTPNCTTPPISTSTPHHKATTMPSFGTPGCISTKYGSFQPSSYTDAYVPPLSLNNDNFSGYQYQDQFSNRKKSEESIRIDSGYGRSSSFFHMPGSRQSYSPNTSLWDTIVTSPVQNLRQKLKGRPSYLDEGRSSGWKIQPQQVLACLIFALILTSIGFVFFISYKHFNRDDIDEDPLNAKAGVIKLVEDLKVDLVKNLEIEDDEEESFESVSDDDLSFLLKDDVTAEEVERMKTELESKLNSYEPDNGPEQSIGEVEAAVLTKLAGSVDDLLASGVSVNGQVIDIDDELSTEVGIEEFLDDENSVELRNDEPVVKENEFGLVENENEVVKPKKKKTKNTNPLMKAVPVVKKSKAKFGASLKDVEAKIDEIKIPDVKVADLDYPDDPTFREGQPDGRVKRGETEDEVMFGDKFRKYKSERDGGFRKKGVVDDRE